MRVRVMVDNDVTSLIMAHMDQKLKEMVCTYKMLRK